MLNIPDSNVIPAITVLVFISAVLLFEGVYLIWRSRRVSGSRRW